MREVRDARDPLRYSLPLPIVKTFYPMGFGLELATDSPEVAATGASLWSRYSPVSMLPSVRLRVTVSGSDASVPAVPSLPKGQEHLFSIVHGGENFAVADLTSGFAFAYLTRDVAADHAYTAHYFLEPLTYMLLAAARLTILHAACVSLHGKGILLAGESGAGKTCLSYACATKGWTFVSGDAAGIVRDSRENCVAGRPFSIRFRDSARTLFPELDRYPATRGLNGKLDIEPPVDDLEIATGATAKVTHLVFLRRPGGHIKAAVEAISPEEAFRRLDQFAMFGDPGLQQNHSDSLFRFLDARPALELTYSELDDAEQVLRRLAAGNDR